MTASGAPSHTLTTSSSAAAARAACAHHAAASAEAGLRLCDLLTDVFSDDEQACAAALADDAFTQSVVDSLLRSDDRAQWFEDAAPAVQLVATLVHFGARAQARLFIEARQFALAAALAGSLTCDDRGEGVVSGWLMCVDVVLRRGVEDDGAEERERGDDEKGGDDDDDEGDAQPVESAYAAACTRLGVRAALEGHEVSQQGGRRLLSKYFAGGGE
jgi:hypothetical protein